MSKNDWLLVFVAVVPLQQIERVTLHLQLVELGIVPVLFLVGVVDTLQFWLLLELYVLWFALVASDVVIPIGDQTVVVAYSLDLRDWRTLDRLVYFRNRVWHVDKV